MIGKSSKVFHSPNNAIPAYLDLDAFRKASCSGKVKELSRYTHEARWMKSPAELVLMRQSASIACQACISLLMAKREYITWKCFILYLLTLSRQITYIYLFLGLQMCWKQRISLLCISDINVRSSKELVQYLIPIEVRSSILKRLCSWFSILVNQFDHFAFGRVITNGIKANFPNCWMMGYRDTN